MDLSSLKTMKTRMHVDESPPRPTTIEITSDKKASKGLCETNNLIQPVTNRHDVKFEEVCVTPTFYEKNYDEQYDGLNLTSRIEETEVEKGNVKYSSTKVGRDAPENVNVTPEADLKTMKCNVLIEKLSAKNYVSILITFNSCMEMTLW